MYVCMYVWEETSGSKLAMVKKMKLCPNGEVQNILQDQKQYRSLHCMYGKLLLTS